MFKIKITIVKTTIYKILITQFYLLLYTIYFSQDFVTVMNEHTDIFIQHIEKEISCGRFIDLQKRLKLFTLDVICETAMGTTVGVQNDENNSYLKGIQRFYL